MGEPCIILLLEDEPLILMDLEFAAQDVGCEALCAIDVAQTMSFLEGSKRIGVAVLDVTLKNDETCVPVAHELDRLGIPYLLHSGDLNRQNETVRELGVRHIPKPADAQMVIRTAVDFIGNATR